MVNKTVISVNMKCNKCKKDAMNCLKNICGINSIEFDMKEKTITVVGEADPVCMTIQLRRKFKCAQLVSHGPLPPPKKEPPKPKKEDKQTQTPPPACWCGCSPCSCRCKLPPPPPPPCSCGCSPCSCRWKVPPPPPPPPHPPQCCWCGCSPCSCRSEKSMYGVYVVEEEIPLCTIC